MFGFRYLLAWQEFKKSSLSPGMLSVVPAVERLIYTLFENMFSFYVWVVLMSAESGLLEMPTNEKRRSSKSFLING